jgi:DNA helicase-2/ATP-dependent DNA helicase PcrA
MLFPDDDAVASGARAAPSLLAHLNPEQSAAVTLPPEHALILAGAGSGKTRVLTTRIAWLIQTGQVSPGGLMAVTFTNKAAKEMLTRLTAMLPVNTRGMWVGTFHGLCNRFLRAHWKLAGLPQTFQILDAQDTVSAIKRVIRALNLDEERVVPKQTAWAIASWKEDALRPKDVEVRDGLTQSQVQVYAAYEAQCQREGVVDFAELLLRTYELMRDHAELRQHYQRRFQHILVDEFQDTNRLQYEWLKMFAARAGEVQAGAMRPNAVFAVGDDDQSIYAFRGAQVGNMAAFEREFGVRHLIKLERNYRSFGNILDSANALIEHNSHRLGKNLRTDQGPGEPVRVVEAASDFEEARWLLDEAQALHREGMARREMAVLYRSNAQSRVIETALFNAGIPYRVYGGLRFFERAEVKHALAYLRLIENANDDTSYLRVVNFPPRGIGARSIEQLQDAARASGTSLFAAVGQVSGRAGTALGAFNALVSVLREQAQGKTLRDIVELVLDHSGLVAHFRQERDGQDRVENLQELVNAAEAFVTVEGFGKEATALTSALSQSPASQGLSGAALAAAAGADPDAAAADAQAAEETGETLSPLAAFLSHASLEAGDNQAQAGQDALQLMTVHAAKGLEFDAVFITGLEEGIFPHENSLASHDGLEEERRLAYVAITRARQRLYLLHAQTRLLHGQTRYNIRSRFFEELPEGALKWVTPKRAGFGDMRSGWGTSFQAGRTGQDAWGAALGGGGTATWSGGPGGSVVSSAKPPPFKPGQSVFHTKFGEGVVLTLEGSGDDARAQVNFPRHGVKWLALSIAKLTPI